jgi:seryl-tRNA synthetase
MSPASLKTRGFEFDLDGFDRLESRRKAVQSRAEELQARRNSLSKQIGQAKASKGNADGLLAEVVTLGDAQQEASSELEAIRVELEDLLLSLPNLPHESVPVGRSEIDNVEIRRWGAPGPKAFAPKDHVEIGARLGHGFRRGGQAFRITLRGHEGRDRAAAPCVGAVHAGHPHRASRLRGMLYPLSGRCRPACAAPANCRSSKTICSRCAEGGAEQGGEGGDLYLIPTSEVSLTNLVREEIVPVEALPIRLTAHTPCFRSEAGAYGKDTRGMIRQHQFDKVEMVQITRPDQSYAALDEMVGHAEVILQALHLPYRVLALCTGDIGFAAAKTFDLEVWLPGRTHSARSRRCPIAKRSRRVACRPGSVRDKASRSCCTRSTGLDWPSAERWWRCWKIISRRTDRWSCRKRCTATWVAWKSWRRFERCFGGSHAIQLPGRHPAGPASA